MSSSNPGPQSQMRAEARDEVRNRAGPRWGMLIPWSSRTPHVKLQHRLQHLAILFLCWLAKEKLPHKREKHGKSRTSIRAIGKTCKSGYHLLGISTNCLVPLLLSLKPKTTSFGMSLTPPSTSIIFPKLIFHSGVEDEEKVHSCT